MEFTVSIELQPEDGSESIPLSFPSKGLVAEAKYQPDPTKGAWTSIGEGSTGTIVPA